VLTPVGQHHSGDSPLVRHPLRFGCFSLRLSEEAQKKLRDRLGAIIQRVQESAFLDREETAFVTESHHPTT
jgi:hypothetical protein